MDSQPSLISKLRAIAKTARIHISTSLDVYSLLVLRNESAPGYIFRFTFRTLAYVSDSDECRTKIAF